MRQSQAVTSCVCWFKLRISATGVVGMEVTDPMPPAVVGVHNTGFNLVSQFPTDIGSYHHVAVTGAISGVADTGLTVFYIDGVQV